MHSNRFRMLKVCMASFRKGVPLVHDSGDTPYVRFACALEYNATMLDLPVRKTIETGV